MSESKFFNKIKISDLKEIKISNISGYKNHIIIGDTSGNIQIYEITSKNKLNEIGKMNIKNKAEQIVKSPNNNICYILSSGELFSVNLPSLNNKIQLIKSGIEKIYVNPFNKENHNQIMTITKKKKLKIYNVDITPGQVTLSDSKIKEIIIEEIPTYAIWVNNSFIYSNNLKTYWLHLNTGKTTPIEFQCISQIIKLEDDKIVLSSEQITIFMKKGKSIAYNPISQPSKDFISFTQYNNYLIGLYQSGIYIYKIGEIGCDLVEKINLEKNDGLGKYIINIENKVVIITEDGNKNCIINLQEKPYEEQVNILIEEKKYNEALDVLVEHVPEEDENKLDIIEKFYLDCAFICLKDDNKDFDLALKYLNLANFNPFELIYMFYEYLDINIIHLDKKNYIVEHKNENQLINVNSNDSEDMKKKFTFLINILIIKRDYILEKYKSIFSNNDYEKEKISFLSSKYSKINLSDSKIDITIKATFDTINTCLIKCMIKLQKNPRDIQSILDNKSINFQIFDNFKNDAFFLNENNKNLDETKFTLAYINEKNENYEEALKVWEYFGTRNVQNDKFSTVGRERTKKIFYKIKENKSMDNNKKQELFKQYIKWLLLKYQNEAFEVVLKTEIVDIKVFMDEIIPDIEKSSGDTGIFKEKFLEYCNQNNKSEEYQTQLLLLYIDKMFLYIPKDKKEVKEEDYLQGNLKKYYDLFLKIIKEQDCSYNKRIILENIENSWLKEPKIYLYSQLKEHDKALNELFNEAKINHKFDDIEKYCKENTQTKPDIFQTFYKLLSDVVKNECQDIINKDSEEVDKLEKKLIRSKEENLTESDINEYNNQIMKLKEDIKNLNERKKPFEEEMLKILKNYGSIKNLDPIFCLNYINEHINICENDDFFNYLSNVISEFTEERNKYKITKNLSQMSSIYKEKEASDYKKKYVVIDPEKTCSLCKKKIGNTMFVIYPNLTVYHSRCVQNLNIDPITGVDFSKKKCSK